MSQGKHLHVAGRRHDRLPAHVHHHHQDPAACFYWLNLPRSLAVMRGWKQKQHVQRQQRRRRRPVLAHLIHAVIV